VFGIALNGAGAYARTTALPGASTARKPEGLRDDWAAVIPVAGTTALDALDQLDLSSGATVLINGVGGGVGIVTAQIARDRGLTVIGTGSTAKRTLAAGLTSRNIADLLPCWDSGHTNSEQRRLLQQQRDFIQSKIQNRWCSWFEVSGSVACLPG
jgi:NADPH:quinone reductase-like Zn-dependent oxidoreductase